jgi:phosphate transport system permease protein
MSRERPELGCSVGCSDIEPLQGPFTALPMIIYNWAGDAKAEFKTALAPATIIVLMAITFLCNSVGAVLRNRYGKR